MDIDNILDDIAGPNDNKTNEFSDDLSGIPIKELLTHKYIETADGQREIYKRFYADVLNLIEIYTDSCPDPHAKDGMYKCSLETWQAIIHDIGLNYFHDNKYLMDLEKAAQRGGIIYNDDLLEIALNLYENLCNKYRKQFFIYDCCLFMGLSNDCMYKLNDLRNDILKKAHTKQEASMRAALASGRSNVTAMAILLNHDYDYTRTTQVIHTSGAQQITADQLPQLSSDDNL